MRGIVLFAHGARDPEWARPFEAIRDRLLAQRPQQLLALGYLEIMQPSLEAAIASLVERGATAVTVFPLFMAQGGHLKQDVPKLLDAARGRHPGVAIDLQAALGDSPEMLDAIAAWIVHRLD